MERTEKLLLDLEGYEQDMAAGGEVADEAFRDFLSDLMAAADLQHRERRRVRCMLATYIEGKSR